MVITLKKIQIYRKNVDQRKRLRRQKQAEHICKSYSLNLPPLLAFLGLIQSTTTAKHLLQISQFSVISSFNVHIFLLLAGKSSCFCTTGLIVSISTSGSGAMYGRRKFIFIYFTITINFSWTQKKISIKFSLTSNKN